MPGGGGHVEVTNNRCKTHALAVNVDRVSSGLKSPLALFSH